MTAKALQERALVIEGLSYHSDGFTTDLRAGGVDALNVTICHFEAGFTECCEQIARWLARFSAPESEWMQIRQASDFAAARAASSSSSFGPMVPVTSVGEPTAAPLDTEAGRQHLESFQKLREALMNGC